MQKFMTPKQNSSQPDCLKKEGYKNEPIAFNLSLNFLYKNEVTEYIGIEFGKSQANGRLAIVLKQYRQHQC
ncbi:MAG: hypothetical protein L6V95_08210 [Candidatus Melainabacteria bacterium]|nr:MAG: hypothetical protein L6V95_08210 [Candidatus Melainabacteria bacterium]